jgi:hypothetical protein
MLVIYPEFSPFFPPDFSSKATRSSWLVRKEVMEVETVPFQRPAKGAAEVVVEVLLKL